MQRDFVTFTSLNYPYITLSTRSQSLYQTICKPVSMPLSNLQLSYAIHGPPSSQIKDLDSKVVPSYLRTQSHLDQEGGSPNQYTTSKIHSSINTVGKYATIHTCTLRSSTLYKSFMDMLSLRFESGPLRWKLGALLQYH